MPQSLVCVGKEFSGHVGKPREVAIVDAANHVAMTTDVDVGSVNDGVRSARVQAEELCRQ